MDDPGPARERPVITVGVAIPVPSPWGEVLDGARIASGDPLGHEVPAHVTLLGPTEIDAGELAPFELHLARVAAETAPFHLHLRGTGTFRPVTEVVFVAVVDGIAMCERLESAIRLSSAGRERRFPYHPHVTIAQNVGTEALDAAFHGDMAGFEAKFKVEAFTLYTHHTADSPMGTPTDWTPHQEYFLEGA